MFERIQKLLDRIESRISLWTIIQGAGVLSSAGIGALVGSATAWVDAYGPIGWLFAGLATALAVVVILLAFAWLRYAWTKSNVIRKWREQTPDINPLSTEFRRQRINIYDFVNPLNPRITGKKFFDCELVGPAILYIHKDNMFIGSGFVRCDIVVLDDKRKTKIKNAIALEASQIQECHLIGCTLYIEPSEARQFKKFGADFITAIPNSNDGSLSPQDTVTDTQPSIAGR